jgi:hypothetical protein
MLPRPITPTVSRTCLVIEPSFLRTVACLRPDVEPTVGDRAVASKTKGKNNALPDKQHVASIGAFHLEGYHFACEVADQLLDRDREAPPGSNEDMRACLDQQGVREGDDADRAAG